MAMTLSITFGDFKFSQKLRYFKYPENDNQIFHMTNPEKYMCQVCQPCVLSARYCVERLKTVKANAVKIWKSHTVLKC
jgi:hypothetical protein